MGSLETTAPPESIPTAGRLSGDYGGASGTEGTGKKISRYSQARKEALSYRKHILSKLDQFDGEQKTTLLKAASRISICGQFLQFHHYFQLNQLRLIKTQTCKQHLICPLCAMRRGVVYMRKYLDKFNFLREENPDLTFSVLTLTVVNGDDLLETFNRLRYYWSLAHQRFKDCKRGKSSSVFGNILGFVGAYEVTNSGNGWHPHLHILCLHNTGVPFSTEAVRREWLEITGDSDQVDVQLCTNLDNPAKDFAEVFKYTTKFGSLKADDVLTAFLTLKKKRLLFSGGIFRGVKLPEEWTDDPLENEPYVDLFYQYIFGIGYQPIIMSVRDPESEVFEQIVTHVYPGWDDSKRTVLINHPELFWTYGLKAPPAVEKKYVELWQDSLVPFQHEQILESDYYV